MRHDAEEAAGSAGMIGKRLIVRLVGGVDERELDLGAIRASERLASHSREFRRLGVGARR